MVWNWSKVGKVNTISKFCYEKKNWRCIALFELPVFFVTYADVSPLPENLELQPLTSRSENKQNIVNTRIKLPNSDWYTGQNCNKLQLKVLVITELINQCKQYIFNFPELKKMYEVWALYIKCPTHSLKCLLVVTRKTFKITSQKPKQSIHEMLRI